MSVISISDCLQNPSHLNKKVILQSWVRTRRDSKAGFSFIALNDGSCFDNIQVVAPNSLENYEKEVLKLSPGCAVICTGLVTESPAKGQSVEIQAESIEVIGWVDDPDTYPISAKRHSFEYLREVAHLRPRTNTFGAVTRVRHCISQAIHQFFHENGFCWVHTPLITASDCEGAGELFRVSTLDLQNLPLNGQNQIDFSKDFFGRETFLTVSGQLNVEAYCLALSKVYTFGPTFRAENSNTTRHLAEFWMVEPEIAFADLMDNAHLAEKLLKYVAKTVLDNRQDDMEFFAKRIEKTAIERLEKLINSKFIILEYSEAIKRLEDSKHDFEFPVKWGVDLHTEHERYLAEHDLKQPLTIINYPTEIKSFYMRLNNDGKTVAAMDVLAPGVGEIIGGSQREERLEVLDSRMADANLDKNHYSWYRDLRKYGTVPHAGFGLGLERLVSYITGMQNIRDVIPYPRVPNNAEF